MDMNLNLSLEITEKDCYRILEQHIGEENFRVINYRIVKASTNVMGFMGDHFRLKIIYQKDPSSKCDTEVFFLKTEPLFNITQAKYVEELGLFKKESMLYQNILNKLTAIAGTHFCPRCYLVKKNFMVFEDLAQRNFKMKEPYLHLEDCESLIECLAIFHSSTIIYEELNSKEGKLFRINQIYEEELEEKSFSFLEGQPRNKVLQNNTKCISDFMKFKLKLEDADEIIANLHHVVSNDLKKYISASDKFRNAVTNCDLWANNFLINDEGVCKLVDFQLARYIPPAYELMLTLFLNTERSVLRKHLENFLDSYYNKFEYMLQRYGLSAKEIFPKSLFLESVQYYKLPAILEATYFTTNTAISSETSNYLLENAERYHEFAFTNRGKYIMEEYDKNPTFKKQFLQLLMPLVEILRNKD